MLKSQARRGILAEATLLVALIVILFTGKMLTTVFTFIVVATTLIIYQWLKEEKRMIFCGLWVVFPIATAGWMSDLLDAESRFHLDVLMYYALALTLGSIYEWRKERRSNPLKP